MLPETTSATPILLYDGECGFCARSVQLVLRLEPPERRDRLCFAPLQGAQGAIVRATFPELARVDSVVWFAPDSGAGRILVRSDAALAIASHLGGIWAMLGAIGRLVPRPLRDAVYDLIARNRLRLAAASCLLPRPDERARFLE